LGELDDYEVNWIIIFTMTLILLTPHTLYTHFLVDQLYEQRQQNKLLLRQQRLGKQHQ